MGKKRGGKESLFATNRPRTAILNFMLQELVCCTGLADQVTPIKPALKKAMDLSNCAMTVLVALCSDVGPANDLKDTQVDLVAVRKVVLDALAKAIKDATLSSEHVDVRYGRLHSLSDLCHRLLTARPSVQVKGQDDGTLHIAKVMLEKNFAVALTNALAEIDLNYPDVKLVVLDILKPLEHLYVFETFSFTIIPSLTRTLPFASAQDQNFDQDGSRVRQEERHGQPRRRRSRCLLGFLGHDGRGR